MPPRVLPALAIVAVVVSACGSAGQAPRQAVSTFTCCTSRDVNRVYHPGDVVTIHWIRTTSTADASSRATPLTLTARLDGAFAGVAQAKASGAKGHDQVTAQPVRVTGRTLKAPVSVLRIPAGASAGFYNLTTEVDSRQGSESGGTIIRVSAR